MTKPNSTLPIPNEKDISRFWSKVEIKTIQECWLWVGSLIAEGYGQFWLKYSNFRSSRIAYLLHYKKDPADLHVLHSCDNPACVNPYHLFLGTQQDNRTDCTLKNRTARGDRHPSRLYPELRPRGDKHWHTTHPEKTPRGDSHYARTNPEKLARGERNGNSKLLPDQVKEIRSLYKAGGTSLKLLSIKFGVDKSVISDIVKYKIWKHLS